MLAITMSKFALWASVFQLGVDALSLPNPNPNPVARSLSPHYYAELKLDEWEAGLASSGANETLSKRTQVTTCEYDRANSPGYSYIFDEDFLIGFSSAIATQFKSSSNANDCGYHQSSYGSGTKSVNWDQHATRSDGGSDCTTTAETGTINGAIQNFFRQNGEFLNGCICLQLTHGGTWQGFVSLSNSALDASTYDCGVHSANICYSGGEADCKGGSCGAK